MRGTLMVCGTADDVGKSQVVAGLCRLLARQGIRVAPFKAQSFARTAFVTPDGHEIGQAQADQAMAAGVEPDVSMNPVLLKPIEGGDSQVVVMGRPWRVLGREAYESAKAELLPVVVSALEDLRSRYDVVLCEGDGSPTEEPGGSVDLANLGLAVQAGIPSVVIGDVDRGGVFAALFGTVALLPTDQRAWLRGFVINKSRWSPGYLQPGIADLERRTGIPSVGVLPFDDAATLDGGTRTMGDRRPAVGPAAAGSVGSVGSVGSSRSGGAESSVVSERPERLDVAVVRFPHISTFSDVDALAVEPDVSVRFVDSVDSLGDPDLIVLPGTKATVKDLAWLRRAEFDRAITARRDDGAGGVRPDSPMVLGVCGGYQMLGTRIEDPGSVESGDGVVDGLGWLDLRTVFLVDQRTRQRRGRSSWRQTALLRPAATASAAAGAAPGGDSAARLDWELEGSPRQAPSLPVHGYEIHRGRPYPGPDTVPLLLLGDGRGKRNEGIVDDAGGVLGTSLHGVLEGDEFRATLLLAVAERRGRTWVPSGISYAGARQGRIDRLADLCHEHLDLPVLWRLVAEGGGGAGESDGVEPADPADPADRIERVGPVFGTWAGPGGPP